MGWIIASDALEATARLMGLPRAWGSTIQHRGTDEGVFKRRKAGGERHGILTAEAYGVLVNKGWPIQISITNYDGNNYTDFQRFAIYDFDSDQPDLCKIPLAMVCEFQDSSNVHYLNTDSGVKGYHNWVPFDASIHQDDVRKYQNWVFASLAKQYTTEENGVITGFIQLDENSWYWIPPEHPWNPQTNIKEHPHVHIETLITRGFGSMIKGIFSPHQKDRTRMSLPMTLAQIQKHDRSQPITDADIKRGENLVRRSKRNHYKHILELIGSRERDEPKSKEPRIFQWAREGRTKFTIPAPEEDITKLELLTNRSPEQEQELQTAIQLHNTLQYTLSEMVGRILNVPCLTQCFEISLSRPGVYWERVNLVIALANMGYSREQIAYLFRHEVNDAVDNANRGITEYQVDYWFRRKYRGRCEYFQELKSKHHCCDLPCGRRSPDQLDPDPDFPQLTRAADFSLAYDRSEEILDMDAKFILAEKGTRSGFTTALPITAKGKGLSILFSVPRTSISERTFPEAMRVGRRYKGQTMKGFVWSSNMKTCLIRAQQAADHEKRTGLPLVPSIPVPREDCDKCHYALKHGGRKCLPIVDQPLFQSDLDPSACMQETFRDEKDDFDVGFITYSKLYSLMNTPTDDALEMREYISSFDVIVLDEISQFIDVSPLELILRTVPKEDQPTYNFFDALDREMRQLLHQFPSNYMVEEIVEYIDDFTVTFQDLKWYDHGDPVDNYLNDSEREKLRQKTNPYLMLLYGYELDTGHKVSRIYNVLALLTEERWRVSKIESGNYEEQISFILPTKHMEMMAWLQSLPGKIIVTDATLPYTNMEKILPGIVRYHFGDPNNTAATQIVIADSRHISQSRIFKDMDRLRNYVEDVLRFHGNNNVMFVLPNTPSWKRFKQEFPHIPPENVTYQRSNETIGVANNLRAMVVVGGTYSPQEAFDWVALDMVDANPVDYFPNNPNPTDAEKHDYAIKVLSPKIWEINARNTFVQTIGRVKDPIAKTPSVVYCYGIRQARINQLMKDCVGIPKVIEIPDQPGEMMHVTVGEYWWNEHNVNFNRHEIQIIHLHRKGTTKAMIKRIVENRLPAAFVDNVFDKLRLDDMTFQSYEEKADERDNSDPSTATA